MSPFPIKKAVITAAGRGVRLAPAADTVQKGMLPFVDRDGLNKPLIQIIAEEALNSGIEEICVVCAPGDEFNYRERFEQVRENLCTAFEGVQWASDQVERLDNLMHRIRFAEQAKPLGYGHAVSCAKDFVGDEAFLLLLGDHVYISEDKDKNCAAQLIELAKQEEAAVSAVHATREHLITRYGTVQGRRVPERKGVYQIEKIIEKPSVSQAEMELQVPGLRAGHYLCFFGMHILTSTIFDILEESASDKKRRPGDHHLLTPSLQELARREKYLALEVSGNRHDIGAKWGMLRTQLALGLSGSERDEILSVVIDELAEDGRRQGRA